MQCCLLGMIKNMSVMSVYTVPDFNEEHVSYHAKNKHVHADTDCKYSSIYHIYIYMNIDMHIWIYPYMYIQSVYVNMN